MRSILEKLNLDSEFVANVFHDMIEEGWFADMPGRSFQGTVLNRAMMPICGAKCQQMLIKQVGPDNIRSKLEALVQMEHNGCLP